MIDQELHNAISQAKIKESIILASKILLKDPGCDKNVDTLQDTFISVISYIASFISVMNIRLWLNVIQDVIEFIDNEKIVIKDVYIIIAKLCLLCDIYIKNPSVKTGTLGIKIIREKIIDMFENDKFKLTMNGMSKFEGIIPPSDSPSYALASQIITGYVHILKQLAELSSDDKDKISDIANKIRHSFDYIIRKKYTFETKFYESDSDAVWFLWGVVSLLFDDPQLDALYQLFCFGYSKKIKTQRVGLLWGASLVMVYLTKKDVARNWNTTEINAIQKVEEVSIPLYNDIKRELIQSGEVYEAPSINNKAFDGIEYISSFRPNIHEKPLQSTCVSESNPDNENTTKYIKCKRNYMS